MTQWSFPAEPPQPVTPDDATYEAWCAQHGVTEDAADVAAGAIFSLLRAGDLTQRQQDVVMGALLAACEAAEPEFRALVLAQTGIINHVDTDPKVGLGRRCLSCGHGESRHTAMSCWGDWSTPCPAGVHQCFTADDLTAEQRR